MTGNDKIHNGSFAHDAGIIPRVLYQLFNTLELSNIDAAVRCSFLELYNARSARSYQRRRGQKSHHHR